MQTDPTNSRAIELMHKYNLTYVYIGNKIAPLWLGRQQFDMKLFLNTSLYELVYHSNNVYVFKLYDFRIIYDYPELENNLYYKDPGINLNSKYSSLASSGFNVTRILLFKVNIDRPVEKMLIRVFGGANDGNKLSIEVSSDGKIFKHVPTELTGSFDSRLDISEYVKGLTTVFVKYVFSNTIGWQTFIYSTTFYGTYSCNLTEQ